MRPKSIVLFDYTYLGYLAFAALSVQVTGGATTSQWLLYAAVLAVSAVLWYLAARHANVVAKWVIVVLGAFSIVSSLMAIGADGLPILGVAVSGIALVLLAASLVLLFRPDALAWFKEGRTPPAP